MGCAASPDVVYADHETATASVTHHLAKLEPPTGENHIAIDSRWPIDVQLSRATAAVGSG